MAVLKSKFAFGKLAWERAAPLSANVLSLCVRAGLEALSCQRAPMLNRSTKLELTTSARMTQNECYAVGLC